MRDIILNLFFIALGFLLSRLAETSLCSAFQRVKDTLAWTHKGKLDNTPDEHSTHFIGV